MSSCQTSRKSNISPEKALPPPENLRFVLRDGVSERGFDSEGAARNRMPEPAEMGEVLHSD
jgi:hypothetical protein